MLRRSFGLFFGLLLVVMGGTSSIVGPVGAHHEDDQARYVVGSAQQDGSHLFACVPREYQLGFPSDATGVGGCFLTCENEGNGCLVSVVDDVLGHVPFRWECSNRQDVGGQGTTPGLVDKDNKCPFGHVSVIPYMDKATTGSISVSTA